MAMLTLRQRVNRLENDFMELSVYCRKQAAEHAYDATQTAWDKIDEMSDRLFRVEQVAEETRTDVGILKRQMGVVTIRLDRIDGEISRLDGNIKALNIRVDHLTDRVDSLHDRVDGLTKRVDDLNDRVDHLTQRVDSLHDRMDKMAESNATMFGAVLQRLDDLCAQVRVNQHASRIGIPRQGE